MVLCLMSLSLRSTFFLCFSLCSCMRLAFPCGWMKHLHNAHQSAREAEKYSSAIAVVRAQRRGRFARPRVRRLSTHVSLTTFAWNAPDANLRRAKVECENRDFHRACVKSREFRGIACIKTLLRESIDRTIVRGRSRLCYST